MENQTVQVPFDRYELQDYMTHCLSERHKAAERQSKAYGHLQRIRMKCVLTDPTTPPEDINSLNEHRVECEREYDAITEELTLWSARIADVLQTAKKFTRRG